MALTAIGTKICRTCGIEKPTSEFNRDRHKSDGFHTMCKKCKRLYRTSEKYSSREYELEHTEDGKRNRHFKKRNVLFDSNDGGSSYKAIYHHTARSTLPKESHTLTYAEWAFILQKQNNRCAICACEGILTRDCMIPLSKGGTLSFVNTQALCERCNSEKGAKAYSGLIGNRWRGEFVSSVI